MFEGKLIKLWKVDNYGQDFPNEVCFSLRPDEN